MAADELVDHYRKIHARMLDDIKQWRKHGWRVSMNGADVTEERLTDLKNRADDLAKVIGAHEKRNS